jgi:hypothetical protein
VNALTVEGTVGAVLGGQVRATDVDRDRLTFRVISGPAQGAVEFARFVPGQFVYTPGAGASGTDTFQIVANDGRGDSAVQTITVVLQAVAPDFEALPLLRTAVRDSVTTVTPLRGGTTASPRGFAGTLGPQQVVEDRSERGQRRRNRDVGLRMPRLSRRRIGARVRWRNA